MRMTRRGRSISYQWTKKTDSFLTGKEVEIGAASLLEFVLDGGDGSWGGLKGDWRRFCLVREG